MIAIITHLGMLLMGVGVGWYLKTKYGAKAATLESKIESDVTKL